MPPKPLVDLSTVDLEKVQFTPADIYGEGKMLPHAHEWALLHGVNVVDPEKGFAVGWKDVRAEESWCKGHFPKWPILPGVLIVETVAHLGLIYYRQTVGKGVKGTLLFGGIDEVKFRDAVEPGMRLIAVVVPEDLRVRRSTFKCQALVEGRVAYEGTIFGILGPEGPQG